MSKVKHQIYSSVLVQAVSQCETSIRLLCDLDFSWLLGFDNSNNNDGEHRDKVE